jgi:hypothetical protein
MSVESRACADICRLSACMIPKKELDSLNGIHLRSCGCWFGGFPVHQITHYKQTFWTESEALLSVLRIPIFSTSPLSPPSIFPATGGICSPLYSRNEVKGMRLWRVDRRTIVVPWRTGKRGFFTTTGFNHCLLRYRPHRCWWKNAIMPSGPKSAGPQFCACDMMTGSVRTLDTI